MLWINTSTPEVLIYLFFKKNVKKYGVKVYMVNDDFQNTNRKFLQLYSKHTLLLKEILYTNDLNTIKWCVYKK